MLQNLISAILLTTLAGCTAQEQSRLVWSQKADNYRIDIHTIETKINDRGIAQCSKYAKTVTTDTLYSSYGYSLRELLANTLGTNEKYLSPLPQDSLDRACIKLRIQNFAKSPLPYDSILQKELLGAFNLEMKAVAKNIEGYKLQIEDSSKLEALQTDCAGSTIRYKEGKFTASAISLHNMTKIMDQHLEDHMHFFYQDGKCYALDFPVYKDFGKANTYFKKYGLRLVRTTFDQTFYDIQARKSTSTTTK